MHDPIHPRGPARRRAASATLAVIALVATACGARLEDSVRDEAIAGLAAGAGEIIITNAGGDGGTTTPGTSGGTTGDGSGTGTATTPGPGTTGGTTQQPGRSSGPATSGGTTQQPGQATGTDTRSAPPGGNGGATDVGVFEDRIVLGNAVDDSGAVPGIFKDAQLATQAFIAFFTATEGTIYGRQLVLDPRDSRLEAGGNREAYLHYCENAFAAIGSMSAFDEGIVGPVSECGIPDVRSAVVNPSTMQVPSVFSADAISATHYPMNQFHYWDESYPGAKLKAGLLYVDNDTTKKQTRLVRSSTEGIGYAWVVDQPIGLAETNYSQHVIKLKDEEVEFLFFQGDAPQAVRLAKAMRQQNYWPKVFALQQNLYKPALIQEGGAAIETAELAIGSVMNENIQHHPELQIYRQWLKQVDPSAEPTGQGAYAWGASLLVANLLKEMGPEVTREKLIAALNDVHDFDGNGLFPPQDIGRKFPANCHIMAKVQDGKFVPLDPPGGTSFSCRGEAMPGSIEG